MYYLYNSAGWAGIIFEHNNIKKNYSVSYCLGDNLKELLGGIIALTGYKNGHKIGSDLNAIHMDTDDNIYEWFIDEEGSKVKFIFELIEGTKNISLKIMEYYDDREDCVFNNNIDFNELIDNILNSCFDILNKYGIIGYYLNFWEEFPVSYYLLLKDYRNKKILFDCFNEINNDCEKEMERTNLGDELKYFVED
jgi:hypothetical protein